MIEFSEKCDEDEDPNLPISFNKRRHTQVIEGVNYVNQSWRMKDRMKTVSVALVLCLNVGVDPPDIVKIQPCARMECWIDPLSVSPQKALELIGSNLQKQYERWQPRARYKQFLDPTVEDVKKLCTSLRRNAKEERVLFHYNGHGVPRPTINGEVWVFNRTYTQYIPLSIYDLQTWMGAPSIYVYDCSNAGIIVNSFNTFADQHEREIEQISTTSNNRNSPSNQNNVQPTTFKNCIQLAACAANQILPMNPNLPADLFTSCLTTPLKIALKWYTLQATSRLVPQVSYELIEKIPGQLNDRRTMLGELNWIFTAITDTIAWNTLSRELFQKLFRQDLLVASLFRNFLLAERILRSYDCTPVSSPSLPQGYRHPMWTAWDLALDLALSQLPDILEKGVPFQNLPFFEEQLTAFQVWLERGNEERLPPEQLPIVLQVLLSQVHRLRALELLAKFVDMGPWAVNLALSVGIFPYVLKLLQSSARELRPLLVFIWAKILAVDCTCQVDLIRDQGHKYFLSVLQDHTITAEYRTLSAFVLACIVHNFPLGQANALQGSLVSICLEQINDSNWKLRQWLTICLGQLWQNYDKARWSGVRDLAHEKLYHLLQDPVPEVRAGAVFALGTFISSVIHRSEHANNIDRSIAMTLWATVSNDMSPLVRMELNSALQWMVILFENQFVSVFLQEPRIASLTGSSAIGLPPNNQHTHSLERNINMKRVSSSSSIVNMGTPLISNFTTTIGFGSIYMRIWIGLNQLANDPHPDVAKMALKIIEHVQTQAVEFKTAKEGMSEKSSLSLPPSPNTRTNYLGESPPKHQQQLNSSISTPAGSGLRNSSNLMQQPPQNHISTQQQLNHMPSLQAKSIFTTTTPTNSTTIITSRGSPLSNQIQSRIKRSTTPIATTLPTVTPISRLIAENNDKLLINNTVVEQSPMKSIVSTNYFAWSVSQFARPSKNDDEDKCDKDSNEYLDKVEKYKRNSQLRNEAKEQYRRVIFGRIDNQTWCGRTQSTPCIVKLHPYESQIAVAYRDKVMIRDWSNYIYSYVPADNDYKKFNLPFSTINNFINNYQSRVSSLEFINAHSYSLVLVGYEDGYVRIWRQPLEPAKEPTFVTAWIALADRVEFTVNKITNKYSRNVTNMATAWYQRAQLLIAGGDARILRLWDAEKELKVGELQIGSDSSVRVLSVAPNGLIAAGCGDGSVRIFDKRLSPQDSRIMTYREHSGAILTACMRNDCESLVSGCVQGSVRLFDIRRNSSIQNWQVGNDVTAMTVHNIADVMVCGGQGLTVYSLDGQQLSQVRSHEGFMGPRMGQTSCLSFHPYKVSLAAGFVENTVSVFMLDNKKYSLS